MLLKITVRFTISKFAEQCTSDFLLIYMLETAFSSTTNPLKSVFEVETIQIKKNLFNSF